MLHARIQHDVATAVAAIIFDEVAGLYPEGQRKAFREYLYRAVKHGIHAYVTHYEEEQRRLFPLKQPGVN